MIRFNPDRDADASRRIDRAPPGTPLPYDDWQHAPPGMPKSTSPGPAPDPGQHPFDEWGDAPILPLQR